MLQICNRFADFCTNCCSSTLLWLYIDSLCCLFPSSVLETHLMFESALRSEFKARILLSFKLLLLQNFTAALFKKGWWLYCAASLWFTTVYKKAIAEIYLLFLPSASQMCASAARVPADLWLLYFLRSGRCLAERRRCQGVLCGRHVLCCWTKILKRPIHPHHPPGLRHWSGASSTRRITGVQAGWYSKLEAAFVSCVLSLIEKYRLLAVLLSVSVSLCSLQGSTQVFWPISDGL